MRYEGQICDGCSGVFTDTDDIVVCPQCATPQHRECYNEKGECVNAHKHQQGFVWEALPAEIQRETNEEKVKTIDCPNCGYSNPVGSSECRQCSMKFTLFGFNVLDANARLEEKENPVDSSIPEYKPPFILGEGEGFENEREGEGQIYGEKELEGSIVEAISGPSLEGEDFSFGGPFPSRDKTLGVNTNLMGAFIGTGAMKYIEKFKRMAAGKRLSFNFAAFFFTPYWFFYRKLIKPGIVFMTINLCLSIIMSPYALEFMDKGYALIDSMAQATTQAQLDLLTAELGELYAPIMLFMAAELVIKLVAGFLGNHLYRGYVVASLKQAEKQRDKKQSLGNILVKGGAAPLYALMALLAENILSTVAGMFM